MLLLFLGLIVKAIFLPQHLRAMLRVALEGASPMSLPSLPIECP